MVDGEVVEPLRVVNAVREVLDDARVESAEVVTALGGHDVFIKKVEMAPMRRSEARRAIRKEAARHVPFDIESVQLDFHILGNHDADSRMDVLLVAAKRERVEERVALLADAGVKVASMDVEAFALHNAFAHNYPGASTGVVALVNVGHELTNISIQRDGAPALTRDFPLGSRRHGELDDAADGIAMGNRACVRAAENATSRYRDGKDLSEWWWRMHARDGRGTRTPDQGRDTPDQPVSADPGTRWCQEQWCARGDGTHAVSGPRSRVARAMTRQVGGYHD